MGASFSTTVALLALGQASAVPMPSEMWLGIYLQGQKVGYSRYRTESRPDGSTTRLSQTVIRSQMLGDSLTLKADSYTISNPQGLISTRFEMESAGRTMVVTANFNAREVRAEMTTNGTTQRKTIPIPAGKVITDDPSTELLLGLSDVQKEKVFTVFAPDIMSLVDVAVRRKAPASFQPMRGGPVMATEIEIADPRATTRLFVSAKGDLVQAVGPFGMALVPEPESVAKVIDGGPVDLADVSALRPDKPLREEAKLTVLDISGTDLSRIPTGCQQIVERRGTDAAPSWRLTVGPMTGGNQRTLIADSARQQPEWVKPDDRVPSTDPDMIRRAKEIVGSETRVIPAAHRLRRWVHQQMGVAAGIGVMRDAKEILQSKEGVCRDHAILLGTLTKAAGIPTRFVNGIIYFDGVFLYHAWVEVWDGERWIGMDSTRPADRLTSLHIKTSQGTVAQAMTGFLLEGARIRVIRQD